MLSGNPKKDCLFSEVWAFDPHQKRREYTTPPENKAELLVLALSGGNGALRHCEKDAEDSVA